MKVTLLDATGFVGSASLKGPSTGGIPLPPS